MIGDLRRALTERQERNLCLSYEGGKSIKEIVRYYGVSDSTVRNILKRNGFYGKSNKQITRDKVIEGHFEGKSVCDLAEEYKRSRSQILKILRDGGLSHMERKYKGMLERYHGGECVEDLARSYGVAMSSVYSYLKREGVVFKVGRPRSYRWESSEGSRLAELYEGGMTLREVGLEFGISAERVRQVLNHLNVETRGN